MMFGIRPSAKVFTKFIKVVLTFLRQLYYIELAAYIDNLMIMSASFGPCFPHAKIVILVLGFSVNFEKAVLFPSQVLNIWVSCGTLPT